jgi:hypothetical protein
MAEKATLESWKKGTTEDLGLLDEMQDRIQRRLIGAYPKPWFPAYMEWLLDSCAENPRRNKVGETLQAYLKFIGAATLTKSQGLVLVSVPDDAAVKRAAFDKMKRTPWWSKLTKDEFHIPELPDSAILTLAKMMAAGAIDEEGATKWAEGLVSQAKAKINPKQVQVGFIEKGIGAGKLIRDETTGMVKPVVQKAA